MKVCLSFSTRQKTSNCSRIVFVLVIFYQIYFLFSNMSLICFPLHRACLSVGKIFSSMHSIFWKYFQFLLSEPFTVFSNLSSLYFAPFINSRIYSKMKFYVKFGSLRRNGAMFYTPEFNKKLFSKFVISFCFQFFSRVRRKNKSRVSLSVGKIFSSIYLNHFQFSQICHHFILHHFKFIMLCFWFSNILLNLFFV